MKLIRKYLDENQFIKRKYKKTLIVLHHTVSSNFNSVYYAWQQSKERIGTAYVINKKGVVYELFPPEYWAYHLGGKSRKEDNMKSIGIELVNEGPLEKNKDEYYWFNGQLEYEGEVSETSEWKGHKYWAKYTDEQYESLAELIKVLCSKFNIPDVVQASHNYNFDLLENFKGIISHCNVREDKTDISKAFNFNKLMNYLCRKSRTRSDLLR